MVHNGNRDSDKLLRHSYDCEVYARDKKIEDIMRFSCTKNQSSDSTEYYELCDFRSRKNSTGGLQQAGIFEGADTVVLLHQVSDFFESRKDTDANDCSSTTI